MSTNDTESRRVATQPRDTSARSFRTARQPNSGEEPLRHRRKLGAASAAAVLIASLLTVAGPGNAGAPAPLRLGHGTSGTDQPRTVTLITGDRIIVHARGGISLQPRDNVRYLDYSYKGHHYVIPSDALPLLRDERLDRRLFDLTGLLDAGYDKRDTLPLLITGGAPKGLKATRALPAIKGFAFQATQQELRAQWKTLASEPGTKIWLDGIRKPTLDVTVPQVGAPAAWAAGFDGAGVKVAVLDTGIDATHPDLAGKVIAAQNFGSEFEDERDLVGHGTHVASTIAGSGAASGGKYKGVAPGASLLDGKVCVEFGCAESWILAGMQWAAESGAQVVNMSLGGGDGPEIDPLEQAVNDLTAQYGTLFVIAAGNSGFGGDYTLGSPASAEAALAVGAVDKSDVLAPFSSRGPRIGDSGVKPEITAPGVAVVAANSKDGFLGTPGERYLTLSGTSMATPHVAGAAAILTQQHPQWTALRRKATLAGSAQPNATDGPFAQGAGRLDVARAITANVSADPVTVGFGLQTWPHEDDPVVTKDVTYHNTGATDVTLQLSLSDTVGGTFSLNTTSVTVPAGGSATVKLTADTRQGTATGPLGGRIVATGAGGVRVQTPYGLDREQQKYTIQSIQTDRAGNPAESYLTVLVDLERDKDYLIDDPDGTDEVRLPAGEYFVFSWIDTPMQEGRPSTTQLVWPKFTVTADQTLRMDARTAGAHKVTVPDKTVTPVLATADATLEIEGGGISASVGVDSFDRLFTGHLGPKQVAGFHASAQGILARVDGQQIEPGLVYTLAWQQTGSFFQGLDKKLRPRDLATARESSAKTGLTHGAVIRIPNLRGSAWAIVLRQELPANSMHIFNTEVPWNLEFNEFLITPEGFPRLMAYAREEDKRYEAGRTYHEKFNRAVFGPALPQSRFTEEWVSRAEDDIIVIGALFGDAQGRAGFARIDKARVALYRNGELVGEQPNIANLFSVPPESARYRAEVSAERGTQFGLSTKVSVTWSFNSSHVDGIKRLPVTVIGFRPQLDDYNSARAGAHMLFPLEVRQQQGSDAKRIRSLTVSVSYDDGATWQDAKVLDLGGRRFVLVKNPSAAGFVSLRAKAEDRGGNTVEQTIIRAYEVK